MSGFHYQVKLIIFALLIAIVFPSAGWALFSPKQEVYLITGGDKSAVSSSIYRHIYEKEHRVLKQNKEKNFFYYQPRYLGVYQENYYMIAALKQINSNLFLYLKHNYNGTRHKQLLLKDIKKSGFNYKKLKDKQLVENFEKYSNSIIYDYKDSDFYSNNTAKTQSFAKNSDKKNVKTSNVVTKHISKSKKTTIPKAKRVQKSAYIPVTTRSCDFREVSKAGQVFEAVKDGVVTIITGAGHGSGFLIDEKGLILTNYHVVKNVEEDDLRIRFKQNQIIKGKIIEADPKNDVAIIWGNLQEIQNYKVLKLFCPPSGTPLVLIGEKILAIGSPLEWETLEKTMTQGVISKFNGSVIMHDANIDAGNSGGPLLNYGGYVVGLNTFVFTESKGIAGSVPISKAYSIYDKAVNKISSIKPPSPELLPDIPQVQYSYEIMEKAYERALKKVNERDETYKIRASSYFDIEIITPPQRYRHIANKERRSMEKFIERQNKDGSNISDSEYQTKGMSYYDYNKPVVRVLVIPKPKSTMVSNGVNLLSLGTGITLGVLTGVYTPAFSYSEYEFKRDFRKLSLMNFATGEIYKPYTTGKAPFTIDMAESYGLNYAKFSDKTYIGVYEFDPTYFDTRNKLVFNIFHSNTAPPISVDLKEKVKGYIVEDFTPYWNYVGYEVKNNKLDENDIFYPFMNKLNKKIKANWNPPKSDKNKSTIVYFKVTNKGKVKKLKVIKSSGDKNYDNIAIEAVKAAAPFDFFPKESTEKYKEVQFTFDYNVLNQDSKL